MVQTSRQTFSSVDLTLHTNKKYLKEVRIPCRRYKNVAETSSPPVPLKFEAPDDIKSHPDDIKAYPSANLNAEPQISAVTQVFNALRPVIGFCSPLEIGSECMQIFHALELTLLYAIHYNHYTHNKPLGHFSSKAVYYVFQEINRMASMVAAKRYEKVEAVQHASDCVLGMMRGERGVEWMGSEVHMGMQDFL